LKVTLYALVVVVVVVVEEVEVEVEVVCLKFTSIVSPSLSWKTSPSSSITTSVPSNNNDAIVCGEQSSFGY